MNSLHRILGGNPGKGFSLVAVLRRISFDEGGWLGGWRGKAEEDVRDTVRRA